MGQKTHPIGFRLGITKDWNSRWFKKGSFVDFITQDRTIRRYIKERFKHAAISRIEIEQEPKRAIVTIHTARPGIIIGRKGAEIRKLREELELATGKEISLEISEIRVSETDATLVAENIARQLEKRVAYRRAMKRAVHQAMRMGAKGIKIACKGRLGGAEIARKEWYKEGRVPLQTIRSDIDYAVATAKTISGTIGVKVWIYSGEKPC
ncbi:MAG TPA: 30S ribosomal protein S3 [bacterium (Candidatus Stahlbacteria)]|nr:30S ribosomal protein S3 [Candidatus Stahlbacteria bacterium]